MGPRSKRSDSSDLANQIIALSTEPERPNPRLRTLIPLRYPRLDRARRTPGIPSDFSGLRRMRDASRRVVRDRFTQANVDPPSLLNISRGWKYRQRLIGIDELRAGHRN